MLGLALGAAQQRVDHAGLVGAAHRPRRFDRRVHRGVRGQLQGVELGETGVQQRLERIVAACEWLRDPGVQRGGVARAFAQRGEADRFDQCAVARVVQRRQGLREFALQRAAAMHHRVEDARGGEAGGGAGSRHGDVFASGFRGCGSGVLVGAA